MILANYWTWLNSIANNITTSSVNACTNTSGSTASWYMSINSGFPEGAYNRQLIRYLSLTIGTGTTAVTASDYALDADALASFSNVTQSLQKTFSNTGFEIALTISGANNSGADIAINEIGVLKGYSSSGSGTAGNILLVREVLDSPITVADGETFSITYTWKMN